MLLALSVISDQGAALGPTAYKVFDERGGSIGRLNINDWVLPDAQKLVSSRHANVRCVSGVFYLEDASTNGTFVNSPGQRIAKEAPARLQDGDRIYIGDYQILVQLIDNSSPALQGGAANAPHMGATQQTVTSYDYTAPHATNPREPTSSTVTGAHTTPFSRHSDAQSFTTGMSGPRAAGEATSVPYSAGGARAFTAGAAPHVANLFPPPTAQPPEPTVTLDEHTG